MVYNRQNNMKRISLFATVVCLSLLFMACSKDDKTETTSGSSTIKEIATFTDLNAYIGRSDIEAMKEEFRSAGFVIDDGHEEGFDAIKRNLTTEMSYFFNVSQGMISVAGFMYGEEGLRTSGKLKSAVLEKINEEKNFSAGRTLKSYRAYVHNGSDAEQYSFDSRDEFVSWLTGAVLNEDVEGESRCTYETYRTTVDIYPDDWAIIVELRN